MFSEITKKMAINLRSQGKSYGEISKILGITRSATQNLINYQIKHIKKKRGPKFVINKRKSTQLKRYVLKENQSGNKVNSMKIIRSNNLTIY